MKSIANRHERRFALIPSGLVAFHTPGLTLATRHLSMFLLHCFTQHLRVAAYPFVRFPIERITGIDCFCSPGFSIYIG